MRALRLTISCFLLCTSFYVYSQEPVVKNYTALDGLANNTVYFIMQDSHGFIWFATDNGVSRFDGSRFKNYTIADGLSDNAVLKIVEDAEGRIWFLTFSGKLSFYKDDKIYNTSNNELLSKLNFTDFIDCFFQDSKKNIWICSIDYSIVKIAPDNTIKKYSLNNNCICIVEKEYGQMQFVSTNEIYTLTNTGFTSVSLNQHITGAIQLPCDTLLLAGTLNGVEALTLNGKEVQIKGAEKYTNIKSFFISPVNKKDLWLVGLNGATEFENGIISSTHEHCYLNRYSLTSMLIDKDKNLWFSSVGSGIFMIPSTDIHLYDVSSGLADNNITALSFRNDSSIMVGTFNGSIQLIEHGAIKIFNQLPIHAHGEILSIKEDKTGNTWILAENAIYKYNANKFSTIKTTGNLWNKTLFIAHDNIPWIGWGRGLKKIAGDSVSTVYYKRKVNRIYAIEQVKNNELFLGTDKGLYSFKDGNVTPYANNNSLLTHRIKSLALTYDSTLWIGTDGYGLISLKGDVVHQYTTKDHLLSNSCNTLFTDSNKIYVATDNGLNIISKEAKRVQISSYSVVSGLVSNHINQVIKKDKNDFILATDRGIIEFDIRKLPVSTTSIPYINSVTVNDSTRPVRDNYNLYYNENNIRIEYGTINFNSGGTINYRYKLTGADAGWNYTTATSVKYSYLHPGYYKFSVATQNVDGEWNPEISSFGFYINTVWWQTWWFRLFIVLSLVGIIVLVIRWRIIIYKQKINRERALSESELKALRAQINPHFVYNSLSAIQVLVLQNQKENANIYFSKFAMLLRSILNNSRVSEITLKEEMDSIRLYLELEMLRYESGFDFQFELDNAINPEAVYIPSMILQPYIENAVLHGLAPMKKNGRLTLKFRLKEGYIICTIEDNGIGRKKAAEASQKSLWKIRPSLGMIITRERIDLINNRQKQKINLEITDLADEKNNSLGTRVTIYFPLNETTMN